MGEVVSVASVRARRWVLGARITIAAREHVARGELDGLAGARCRIRTSALGALRAPEHSPIADGDLITTCQYGKSDVVWQLAADCLRSI